MTTTATLEYLTMHGIKPSQQRIAVMEYLMKHRTHPTVEDIYNALHTKMPTLSKTTVYNTLKVLTEQGAIIQLTIDEHCSCFDANMSPHAHFLCHKCGTVYDLELKEDDLERFVNMPEGTRIDLTALYFRGCCNKCQAKEKQNQSDNL